MYQRPVRWRSSYDYLVNHSGPADTIWNSTFVAHCMFTGTSTVLFDIDSILFHFFYHRGLADSQYLSRFAGTPGAAIGIGDNLFFFEVTALFQRRDAGLATI